MQVAQTILEQLGGKRFIAMTGARDFVGLSAPLAGLQFKIGRGAKKGITHVVIRLTKADLYDVEFVRVRGINATTVAEDADVHAECLQAVFTEYTGFDTHL